MTTKSIITIGEHPLSKKDFMDAVEQEIIYLHDTGDLNHVMNVLNGLEGVEGITGHMKARLLYAASEWFKINHVDQSFTDHVETFTELKKVTVDRYVTVQRFIENYTIPKEIAERPMRDLVPIAKTLSQGYEISKDQWRKIKNVANDGELRDILRKIKGKAERKNAKVLKMSRDGSLYLYLKGKAKKFIGYLNVKDAETDTDIAEEIEKIKIARGVLEE